MPRISKASFAGVAALFLAGCTGIQLQNAQNVAPEGSEFQTELYGGYVSLASAEYAEGDYTDSDFFATRAIAAGTQQPVGPQEVAARNVPDSKIPELTWARNRIVASLSQGAAEKFPKLAANAQIKFDCWIQEQEENFQLDDIAACRGASLAALTALDEAMAPPPAPKQVASAALAPAPKQEPIKFVVFFDFDSAELNEAARQKLEAAVGAAKVRASGEVIIGGHTDLAGADEYNAKLARLRAVAIADAIVNAGLRRDITKVESFGELQPAVLTDDDVREPGNRRVEIIVE